MIKFRRKHYLVDRDFQFRFIFSYVFLTIICISVMFMLFVFLSEKKIDELQWKMHIGFNSIGEIIVPYLFYSGVASLALTIIIIFIITCIAIQKAEGPVYRMKADIESIARGNLSINIILRKKDVFKSTAKELNAMTKSMQQKFSAIIDNYGNSKKFIDILIYIKPESEMAQTLYKDLLHSVSSLKESIENLRKP